MFQVVDQWDCVVAEFEDRADALGYIALREKFYRDKPACGPRFHIKGE